SASASFPGGMLPSFGRMRTVVRTVLSMFQRGERPVLVGASTDTLHLHVVRRAGAERREQRVGSGGPRRLFERPRPCRGTGSSSSRSLALPWRQVGNDLNRHSR